MAGAADFLRLRDSLIRNRQDQSAAERDFAWPTFEYFNWALDYFDHVAQNNRNPALRALNDNGADETYTFWELSQRSAQVANFLLRLGVTRADRVLVMLGNVVPLWESMLALIKIGAVIVPATTLLQNEELADRLIRGKIKAVIADASLASRFENCRSDLTRISVGDNRDGWVPYSEGYLESTDFTPRDRTRANEELFLYFTSGTTSKPKLVSHSHVSYPVGHLTTLYWLGLQKGDVHLNLSSAGWAKHAWSCFFAPWNAEAATVAYQYARFDANALLDTIVRSEVTTFCAPPTVWRMLVQQPLEKWRVQLREVVSAGEPLNPEIIKKVRSAWGLTIRDGFGQTETTALIGNPPGNAVKAGSMGRPLPGCPVVLLSPDGEQADEGEICLDLAQNPLGLTSGYADDHALTADRMKHGFFHTGDIAVRDSDGYFTYVGRADDVFKSSDYRISPFELESVIIEHVAVAEAAVVPSPDALRLSVPKAFIVLASGFEPNAATAAAIFLYVRQRVSPFQRIRRLEFGALPKTISGKIRRVELRERENNRAVQDSRHPHEFWEEDI
jgi:acetyl-CoA synthetase